MFSLTLHMTDKAGHICGNENINFIQDGMTMGKIIPILNGIIKSKNVASILPEKTSLDNDLPVLRLMINTGCLY